MVSIKDDHLLNGISGKLGRKIVIKTYGKRTIISKKPSTPKKRSAAQKANSEKFRLASMTCKSMLRNPEIKGYFKRVAVQRGQASAYTAAMKDYLPNPTLFTQQYLLEQARNLVIIDKPKNDDGMVMEIKVVTTSGDVIAQGIAIKTDTDHWKYVAPFTGLEVIVQHKHKKK